MQVYQVPQFLDSGNRILGPLTLWQLIYAMVGGTICFVIFNFFSTLIPGIGIFALLPVAPVAGLTAYLSLGKYNGRDADIYVLKMIVHFVRPRRMTYSRKPDLSEIDQQIKELTPEKILERWRERREITQGQDIFKSKDVEYKVSTIKNLTSSIENIQQNVLYEIYSMEKKKEDTEALVKTLQETNNPYSVPIVTKPSMDLEEKIRQENLHRQENLNFLNLAKKDE